MKIQIQPEQKLPNWAAIPFLLAILILVNLLVLHYYARQHPLGSLESASPLFWDALTLPKDKAEYPLQAFLSSRLAKRYTPDALRQQLSAVELDPAYRKPVFSHHYKKSSVKKGSGYTYYQTPEHVLLVNWRTNNFWFTERGWFALRWKVSNACLLEPAVKRKSKRLLRELTRSAGAAYELTVDHAFPRRQVKWITLEQLENLRQQIRITGNTPELRFEQPARLKAYSFVSQQNWNGQPVEVTFSGNGYGKKGCRLRVAKIKLR